MMAAIEIAGPNGLHRGARRDLDRQLQQNKSYEKKRDDDRPAQTDRLAQRTDGGIVGIVI